MYGRTLKLYRYPEKGEQAVEEQQLYFAEGHGIEGDWHSDGSERQISLLSIEDRQWMEQQERKGFCFTKFKENILTEGLKLSETAPGDILEIGEVLLEITGTMKSCHPELCGRAREGISCRLTDSSRFAKVIRGGSAAAGAQIQFRGKDVLF